jgi:hypothetical protein
MPGPDVKVCEREVYRRLLDAAGTPILVDREKRERVRVVASQFCLGRIGPGTAVAEVQAIHAE